MNDAQTQRTTIFGALRVLVYATVAYLQQVYFAGALEWLFFMEDTHHAGIAENRFIRRQGRA